MGKLASYLKWGVIIFSFLVIKSVKAQCVASYTYATSGNGSYTFTSTSVGTNSVSTTYTWSLGNNTYSTGIGLNVVSATYTANGTYTVSLAINNPCNSYTSAIITVTNVGGGCFLNSNLNYNEGTSGQVNFTNISTGTVSPTTYTIYYGDGSSSNSFAAHTYSANGIYTATLVADNNSVPACVSSNTFNIMVTTYCNLVPSFSYIQGTNGFVSFQSTTTGTSGVTYYSWNFGDGGFASGPNANHVFSNGTYTVTLGAADNASTCTLTTSQVITVTSNTCNLNVSFTHTVGAAGAVSFSSTTTGTIGSTNYLWNYGDGYTSTGTAPTHIYASVGAYPVILTVSNGSTCVGTYTQMVNITTGSCVANANFSIAPTATAQVWNVTPSFPWNVIVAQWSWGDGTFSNNLYTSHSYSAAGTYTLCLTVTVSCGSVNSFCGSYYINKSNQDMSMIQVNIVQPGTITEGIRNFEEERKIDFALYPNPTNGVFTIVPANHPAPFSVQIFNTIGELVYESKVLLDAAKEIRPEGLTSGVYFVTVKSGNSGSTKKLIIK